MRPIRVLAAILSLVLLARGAAWAEIRYQIQPIVWAGDRAGEIEISPNATFDVSALNDRGQLLFAAKTRTGRQALIRYADGGFTPIAVAGGDGPGGKWSKNASFAASMNQSGNIVLGVSWFTQSRTGLDGVFLWDDKARTVTPVALPGMPATGNLTFYRGFAPAAINNRNEIAFAAYVKIGDAPPRSGVFFLGRDGRLLPVGLPAQPLPGGDRIFAAWAPDLNDAGVVSFVGWSGGTERGYLWDQGELTRVIDTGHDKAIWLWLNNANRNVSVMVSSAFSLKRGFETRLYRWAKGELQPLAMPNQVMPGGGRLRITLAVSPANEAGQCIMLALLKDDRTAAYLIDLESRLSLLLRSGMATDLGVITRVGAGGVGLNSRGQIALIANFAGRPAALVLLTPVASNE